MDCASTKTTQMKVWNSKLGKEIHEKAIVCLQCFGLPLSLMSCWFWCTYEITTAVVIVMTTSTRTATVIHKWYCRATAAATVITVILSLLLSQQFGKGVARKGLVSKTHCWFTASVNLLIATCEMPVGFEPLQQFLSTIKYKLFHVTLFMTITFLLQRH